MLPFEGRCMKPGSRHSRSGRCWTLEAARAILPDVRARTEAAIAAIESIERQRESAAEPVRVELDAQAQRALSQWAREMEALGVDVKGPWLVDFDNGEGYFCWRAPEPELVYFHGYDEGFEGRVRIQ